MKTEFDSMPPAVIREGNVLRIFFGFEPVEKEDKDGKKTTKFVGYNVDIKGDHSYGSIVSAIVKSKFPNDSKDAIMANRELVRDHPKSQKVTEYLSEYTSYQNWRTYAKSVAQSVIDNIVE